MTSTHPRRQRFARTAGLIVPLSSLRGEHDMGVGEILDLIPLADWLHRWHHGVVQLLPINETAPGESSPYTAISGFALEPTYISTSVLPDLADHTAAARWLRSAPVRRQIAHVRQSPRYQRPLVHALKHRLLEFAFEAFEAAPGRDRLLAFERFCQAQAWWLDDYAMFRALKEQANWHSWETWSEDLRERTDAAVRRAEGALSRRMRFVRYLQWVAAEQWQQVRAHCRQRGVLLKGDLPFVCGRDSADVWVQRDQFDLDSSAGAPPDAFSPTGQAWGLPLCNWAAARANGFQWWRHRARQARALYDVVRIDHVVGLYRTFAIPVRDGGRAGFVPSTKPDQLRQGRELLGAILEECGSETRIVAEDLGTVPDWVRASLTSLAIPGYKVFRWEATEGQYLDPRSYPTLSVATTGTHDTDTVVTWWETLAAPQRDAVLACLDLEDLETQADQPRLPPEVLTRLLRRLYEAPSVMTILPIQDLFGWVDRINVPATVSADNWSFRLPCPVQELEETPDVRQRLEEVRRMIDECGRRSARGTVRG